MGPSVDDKNRAVHLGRTRDHVLNEVSVARAVHVSVVTSLRLVLSVVDVDRDASGLFFGRRVDLVILLNLSKALIGEHSSDRRRKRRLAMVDVTDGADINVRLRSFKLSSSHLCSPVLLLQRPPWAFAIISFAMF